LSLNFEKKIANEKKGSKVGDMFIKRNRSRQGGREYGSVLLVKGQREKVSKKSGRPCKGQKQQTRVMHRTMANLSRLPEELVEVIERWCRGERAEGAQGKPGERKGAVGGELRMEPCYGVLCGLHEVARRMGLVEALGPGRMARLALFLIYARVARQGSRLGAARWAEDHAVAEVLGLEKIDEDDLYEALDWLQANQELIERALAP
jgi:hypothetical protein